VAPCLARYASLVSTARIPGARQVWTRRLLRCGGRPCFVAVFLSEGAVREGYRPLRHPVSSSALGSRGWVQAGNFAVAGTLFLAAAAGLTHAGDPAASSRAAPALIGAAGAGLMGSAVFTTDPVSGYPPGTPDALTQPTRSGIAHNLAAVPVFLGLPAAALISSWQAWRAGQRGFRALQCGHRHHHASGHDYGRRWLRPVTQAGPLRRAVPARQHHHRHGLAHSPVRMSTSATPRHRRRQASSQHRPAISRHQHPYVTRHRPDISGCLMLGSSTGALGQPACGSPAVTLGLVVLRSAPPTPGGG
jgi:hypothetical protein